MEDKKKIELQWGETPFDNLSKDDLLYQCRKMYDCIISAQSALRLCGHNQDSHPFWTEGTGGRAIEKCRQVNDPILDKYESEDIYRVFYRYAVDLIWDSSKFDLGIGWVVCPVCGKMFGKGFKSEKTDEGKQCNEIMPTDIKCAGTLRLLEWGDLKKK